jgi:formiminotetrahydrofolate cyclodeaminase
VVKWIEKSVTDLLDAFASPSPTPGGGSAAALAGSVGAALLMMVARLPKTRGSEGDRGALDAAAGELEHLRGRLRDLVDLDSRAYEAVMSAYKLPKSSDLDRAARREAIQQALREATATPLAVMECSARALGHAGAIASHGSRNAASDVGVGVELLAAALRAARLNVEINLEGLEDSGHAATVRGRADDLERRGVQAAERARESLKG